MGWFSDSEDRDVRDEVDRYYEDHFPEDQYSEEQLDRLADEAMWNGEFLQHHYDQGNLVNAADWDGKPYPWRRQ